jgi:undecaprenyl diphosphate synthase
MSVYRSKIDKSNIPAHIAIIMDGNGRWANLKSLPRLEGHRQGTDVIEPIIDAAIELGVKAISLYAFSTENWSRPKPEVLGLWKLLDAFFERTLPNIMRKGVRIMHSGSDKKLPGHTKKTIANAIDVTQKNKTIVLNLCLNYGSRQEILDAFNIWNETAKPGKKITTKGLEKYLYTKSLPDVDLLIRTSGENRISNFLLWQIAYAELYFSETLWPDYTPEDLYEAVYYYQHRERRFGGI